jgi:transcriptional regulator with XRE-family HTH domain
LVSAAQTKRALAARLRELRHERKWSQEKLAEAADMHRTYLAGIERALRNPALENLVKLANALDVTLAEMFSADAATPPAQPGIRKRRDH